MRKPIFTIWEKKKKTIQELYCWNTETACNFAFISRKVFEITDNKNCLDKCTLKIRNTEYSICTRLRVSPKLFGQHKLHNIAKLFCYPNIFFLLTAHEILIISIIKYRRKEVSFYNVRTAQEKFRNVTPLIFTNNRNSQKFQRHKINRCPLYSVENSLPSYFVNI